MKTAVTVLQELMVKFGDVPDYECTAQSGPAHSTLFKYRCSARGVSVEAAGRSKREAKQEAARLALQALAARGEPVPPGWGAAAAALAGSPRSGSPAPAPAPPARTHVALLKELCDEYRLGALQYSLVSDTGPAHQRLFRLRASVGPHAREAEAGTKKAARQLAAEQLYGYLRENLTRLTRDFVEEDALVRAHEKAMERYVQEEPAWRPDLGQRVADYHRGLSMHTEPARQDAARRALDAGDPAEPERTLQAAAAALGVQVEWSSLPRAGAGPLHVVSLAPGAPSLALAGGSRAAAAEDALRALRRQLRHRPGP